MDSTFNITFPLTLDYDNSSKITFEHNKGNDLNFNHGIYYLCGENGSGKTTFLNILALITGTIGKKATGNGTVAFSGEAYNGRKFTYLKAADIREKYFCIFPQKAFFLPVSTRDNYIILNGSDKRKEHALSSNEFPDLLSGGQQQRILMDILLDDSKPVWFLDEPLTNMDIERRHYFWKCMVNAINNRVNTIFFIDHWLDSTILMDRDFHHHATITATRYSFQKGKTNVPESQPIEIYENNTPEGFFSRQGQVIKRELTVKKDRVL
ncbi:ATP-binding cassette domain-containing protein [Thermodesulfobacteriota bacterium]